MLLRWYYGELVLTRVRRYASDVTPGQQDALSPIGVWTQELPMCGGKGPSEDR